MTAAAGWFSRKQASIICAIFLLALGLMAGAFAQGASYRFDFGASTSVPGYVAVDNTVTYSASRGYGWVSTTGLLLRDRGTPDDLRSDFIFTTSTGARTFRVSGLTPGLYLLKALFGDASYGDHSITVAVGSTTFPTIAPKTNQYLLLTATVTTTGTLDIVFSGPTNNWVVNALTLEPATAAVTTTVESSPVSEWDSSVFSTNPIPALRAAFDPATATGFAPTGLSRADYLRLIGTEVDFWKTKQNSSGAIIDPYANSEIQYSTPAFAQAAATLVVYAGRSDLLEPAAKAMDWATARLNARLAAGGHEDFYPPMLVHALKLLKPRVTASRSATWESNLNYDPYAIYRQAMGSMNWNIVSSCGEALLQLAGIRSASNGYVAESWAAQGRHFTSPYGLYMEGPMAYDHFPRIFLADVLEQGYSGAYSAEVREALDRAAVASLFMQSPWGELPAGGRSAHHQWNEAEQCFTYEIYAAHAREAGDLAMAGAYKRAAHLALSSMFRWVRPSGEMQVVKNWVNPSSRHGYESYSYHSQYNILPMAMLSAAYEYAGSTEDIAESPAPADTGGFVFKVDGLNKVFANAGGTYVEIETTADHHYDATGLIRVHKKGIVPQLGPSDSLLASASYTSPNSSPITTGVGVSWQDAAGAWRTLGDMSDTEITSVAFVPITQSPGRVAFDITYSGNLPNATAITERYVVTPAGVQLTTEVAGYSGPLRYVWPVLSNDGKTASTIAVSGKTVSVSQSGGTPQTFTAPGAQSVRVEAGEYSNHNGWARTAFAEFPSGGGIVLLISQQTPSPALAYWKGDAGALWNTNSGNTNWSRDSAGTLDAGVLPDATTDIVFTAAGAANLSTTLGSDFAIRGLSVTGASAVNVGGTHALSLGEGGIAIGASGGATSISTSGRLVLTADQTWSNASAETLAIASEVTGSYSLTKTGGGTLVLAGANTYTGATTVTDGTLSVNGSVAGPVVVGANAVLAGGGSLQAAATINGIHRPGNGVGTQSFSSLSYGGSARLAWQLGENSAAGNAADRVIVAGAATIDHGAVVDLVFNGAGSVVNFDDAFWSQPRTWTLLTAGNVQGGTFAPGSVSADAGGRTAADHGFFALQQTSTAVTMSFTPYTARQKWNRTNFGTDWNAAAVSGDLVDADGDGLTNLLEYAVASDPKTPSQAAVRIARSDDRAVIRFTRNADAADVTLRVVATDDLAAGMWTELARSEDGGPVQASVSGVNVIETGAGSTRTVEIEEAGDGSASTKRFFKIVVE